MLFFPRHDKKTFLESSNYRPDIDGLRALAVFAVFIFHAFPKTMHGGFIGVDIFFVISGFLISSTIFSQLEHDSFSFWNFYSRRIRRIYPALITVFIACLILGWLFLPGHSFFLPDFFLLYTEYAQLCKHVAGGAGFISNILLWFESGYFNDASELKPLLHLWSLGIEEQFYILWPLLVWLAWKKRLNLFLVSAVFFFVSFALNLYFYHTDLTADFFSPYTRFWELLSGALLAWFILHPQYISSFKKQFLHKHSERETIHSTESIRRTTKLYHFLSLSGALLLVFSVFFIKNTSSRGYPGVWAIFPVASAVLLIAAGKDGFFNKWVLSNKILVWFGLISYPIYLWHWPLLSLARVVLRDVPPLWLRAFAFPVCVFLAWATTRFIENPLRFGNYAKTKTIALFTIMLALGLTGFTFFKKSEALFTTPFGKEVNKLVEIKTNTFSNNRAFESACFVFPNKKSDFKECNQTIRHPSKPTMAIWGDSHVASFVPGFENQFGNYWNIWSRSTGSCLASGVTDSNSACSYNNKLILSEIINNKPDKVVLVGCWFGYNYEDDFPKLKELVDKLRKHNINDIAIIGPVPVWDDYLPNIMIKHLVKENRLLRRIKTDSRYLDFDKSMSRFAASLNVKYISIASLICNEEGCLTMTENSPNSIIFFDKHHLTELGSNYLVSLFRNDPFFAPKNIQNNYQY